ncbi:unnamed protein product [Rotaria sp. Silwood2]|nr:unnamed protein product [Rotaria sp. Silwood2]
MGNQKSKTAAGIEPTGSTTTSTATVSRRRVRRMVQNFLLVWLDANIDESKEEFKNALAQLRQTVVTIMTFTDADECIQFIMEVNDEKVFLIISGSLGQHIVPKIDALPQVDSIYIYCRNRSVHEQWAKTMSKVKGVHTEINSICKALQIDREQCDRSLTSIIFNGIDPLFMYTQLLKETMLEIEDDDVKSIKDLVDYCRLQKDIPNDQIKQVESEYRNHTPIWWYTAETFIYPMLNRGLRVMDVDIIMKLGFFIRHLHNHITKLHRKQQGSMPTNFQVFRGQGLSVEDFEKMKQTNGGLMSFNNFLSTSHNRKISLENFARPATNNPTSVGILFVMAIDTAICMKSSTPFAEVSKVSFFKGKEKEVLFSTHTIFRINRIERIPDEHTDRLWQVNLTLAGDQDDDFSKLTAHLREEFKKKTGWNRLGEILIKLGESAKAEQLYKILLDKATSNDNRAQYNFQLGQIHNNIGEYSKALAFYEKALPIYEKIRPPNHPDLAASYNSIGLVYYNMAEYSKALSSYERSLEIRKIALPPNHPDLAASYGNIGTVYARMGEYSKALSSYERSLEIEKIALPANHPDFAQSYNNIGMVYDNMGEYSKAVSSYERSLEIQKIALPPNHPDLAGFYEGIGLVYNNMGEYSKALSSYERSLEIKKTALPPNHPSLAASYNNIGLVYNNMGEYSKALSSHERSLEIRKIALPPNHPDLAASYLNIGSVYDNMGEYSKALSSYERSLEIQKIALPPNHPDLAASYGNIGTVYAQMGEYSKALSSYERSLEIKKIALPPNHPSLAASYNNIGLVYNNMGEYSKALSSYERSLEIRKIALPPNHPDFAQSYNNIGMVYNDMGEYSKALSNCEKAQEIWKKSLPPTHPHIALVNTNIENIKKKM